MFRIVLPVELNCHDNPEKQDHKCFHYKKIGDKNWRSHSWNFIVSSEMGCEDIRVVSDHMTSWIWPGWVGPRFKRSACVFLYMCWRCDPVQKYSARWVSLAKFQLSEKGCVSLKRRINELVKLLRMAPGKGFRDLWDARPRSDRLRSVSSLRLALSLCTTGALRCPLFPHVWY